MNSLLFRVIDKNKHLIEKGKVANYIPALEKANPNDIGVCIIDKDGNIYKAGDYNTKFTIQSISKVLSLILAIYDNGEELVFEKVGYEPTDEPFNSLYKLDLPGTLRPSNPMINSGAILTTSLIKGEGEEKFTRLLEFIRLVADNPKISLNEEVYKSEKSTGDKNKAIAYLMRARGYIDGDVEGALDTYFKQCSIEIDTIDLAKIGLYIGTGLPKLKGFNFNKDVAHLIRAIMMTCGMYNFSGEYAAKVGIPSKSGVGGGIMGCVPSKFGIGVYSPALDKNGNSIVGYGIMKDLSKELNLSLI